MTFYRKKAGTDTWHWCKNCSNWWEAGYVEENHAGTERPKSVELCDERRGKERNKNRKTYSLNIFI